MNQNPPNIPKRPASATKVITITSTVLALVTAGLWAVDNFLGRQTFKVVLMILLVFLGALLVIWLLVWLFRRLFAGVSSARSRREEARAAAAAAVSREERAELDALEQELNSAVRVLRESKLAKGLKGDEVLYALPWILFLGPPASGKTSALRESGVDFPLTSADAHRPKGALEPGCHFWFSRGAIVLDLAGRIGLEEEGFDVFKGFLVQLKGARRNRPLDGVVVCVDLAQLSAPGAQADRIAALHKLRLEELTKQFGIRLPVYVVFTNCDRLEGFQEFFGRLHSRERSQVWGATIARSTHKHIRADQIFAGEFDRLLEQLSQHRLQLLAGEKDAFRIARIYNFPARLASLKGALADFIGTLFQPTPYTERPIFRGFYLTAAAASAPQPEPEGSPEAWQPGRRLAAEEQKSPKLSLNFFLHDLFTQVLFADRPLATATVGRRLRRRLLADIALVSTIVISLVLLAGMSFSFVENRKLIESTRVAALRVANAGWDARRTSDLMALEDLRERVEELDRHGREGPRLSLRWGLYSGDKVNQPARRVYFSRVREGFAVPVAEILRRRLHAFSSGAESASSFDEFYTALKAYLMMTEPPRAEESFLLKALEEPWRKSALGDAEQVALRHLKFYAQQLRQNDPELQLSQDGDVVAHARRALSQFPALVRIYTSLKNEGNTRMQPYTLAQATGGKGLDFLASAREVPGVFTEDGWGQYFRKAAAMASRQVVQDDWVIGPTYAQTAVAQMTDAEYERRIQEMYFAEYADEWQKFMDGISVRPLANLSEARAALDSFSQQDSPLSRLLMNVTAQTMLRRDPEKGSSISGMVSGALATLGLTAKVNRQELVLEVADQFLPLHQVVTSPDGKSPSTAAQYIEGLGKVYARLESLFGAGTQWEQVKAYVAMIATNISGDEFRDAFRLTARINQVCRTRSTAPVGPLLEQPLRQAWAAILRDVGLRLDGLWKTRIAEAFRRDVENRFPFNPGGPDLPLSMLSQFIKPEQGSIWTFYESELKPFLAPAENRWAPAPLIGAQVDFSPAFLQFLEKAGDLRQALYSFGGTEPSIRFDLTPMTTPGVTESLLEIDGQRLLYRNEPPLPQPFTWPGKAGSPHARIQISIVGSGERPGIPSLDGEWAFFRLLRRAPPVQLPDGTDRLALVMGPRSMSRAGRSERRRNFRQRRLAPMP